MLKKDDRNLAELRQDPISGRWVIFSAVRALRPYVFVRGSVPINRHGPCAYCYGNESKTPPEVLAYGRNGSGLNTSGWTVRVVPNDFPALGIEGSLDRQGEGIFNRMHGIGAHEVIIETPDHQSTLATLPAQAIEQVLWAYRDRVLDLKKDPRFRYILIFKNHGVTAGAFLEHTHSQLIALPMVPEHVRKEVNKSFRYFKEKERCIFCDIIRQEVNDEVRVIIEDDEFVALAPYAPRFPFETWLLTKQHSSSFESCERPIYASLARMLGNLLERLDAVLERPAYNYVIHTSPIGEELNDYYHWHIEITPKLTVAGFEWCSGIYFNPTPPEESARFLREASVSGTAWRDQQKNS